MPETLLLSGKASVTFFLHPNQSREVSFVPLAGVVKATSAAATEDVSPGGPPHPDPDDQIDIPIDVPKLPDADLENISVNLMMELHAQTDLSGRRAIAPVTSVSTDLRIKGGVVADIVKEHVFDANKFVKSELGSLLNSFDVRKLIGDFLTEGVMELVKRGDVFHDISLEGSNFLVKHFPSESKSVIAGSSMTAPLANAATGLAVAAPRNSQAAENLKKIDHIVVLVMENRSFDHMFGYLKAQEKRTDVDGLNGTESNSIPGVVAHVKPLRELLPSPAHQVPPTRFPIDPEHGPDEVESQIADGKMSGFLKSFLGKAPLADPDLIMGFNTKDEAPVYHFLAENFVICDAWFASHPGPTWPNRFCTLTGSTPSLNNLSLGDPQIGYVTLPTLFDFLPRDFWVYYEHDISFLRIFDRYRLDDRNVIPFGDTKEGFFARAKAGTLPQITFIDPNFVDVPPVQTVNDDHPPADIGRGQELVSRIYNALVSSPQWSKTLFIITYDEHGGFYDHAAPPGTEAYKGPPINVVKVHPQGKAFYRVRVPTIVISPWVKKGKVENTVFNHTTIIRTIMLRFQEQRFPELGPRVKEADDLGSLLTRDQPRLNAPTVKVDGVTGAEASPAPAKLSRGDFHIVMRYFPLPPKAHPF